MLIVRMETKRGVGVYRAEVKWPKGLYPGSIIHHPSPLQDRDLRVWWDALSDYEMTQYHFAFLNPTQAKAWFYSDEHVRAMEDAGVGVGIYLVDDEYVKEGWTQVVFIKAKALRIDWYDDIEAGLAAYALHEMRASKERGNV